jgi:ABC-type lipoprotein export system ATPase subunit
VTRAEETVEPPGGGAVRISDLHFRYGEGDFRLEVPDLAIESGSTVAFIGPSGCGKTTLLNLMAGIVTPTRGRIWTCGTELGPLSDAERRAFRISTIGLVFQEFELLEYLTVLDNVLLPYRVHSALRLTESVRKRARGLSDRVGMADKLYRYPRKLSHGERQRVAVCRSVLPEPAILLADEPTGNLDPSNKDRVLDILFDFIHEQGTTLVAVTHDHELLSRFERVIDFRDLLGSQPDAADRRESRMTG